MSRQREGVDISVPFIVTVLVTFLFASAYFGPEQVDDLSVERQQYCEMVEIFKNTDGQHGWPPFDGEC